jgi:hypothetical protein
MPTDDELKEFGLDGEEQAPSLPVKLYETLDYTGMDAETAVKAYLAWAEIEELARAR